MADRRPGPICSETLGPDWIDPGTSCRSRSSPPVSSGLRQSDQSETLSQDPSFLETLRQQAIIGVILGIRKGLGAFSPMGLTAVTNDEVAANTLLAQGNYDRAFEVATGFAEYFQINREGSTIGATRGETAAVMMGHATGFNQAVQTVKGETRSGAELAGIERFATGLDALTRIASTTMTVAGGVGAMGIGGGVKVVSPVYRLAGRDIVIVETSLGRQAFYRSTGANSGNPGKWFPVDEVLPSTGWFNKANYTQGPGLGPGNALHRLGTNEFARISEKLGKISLPQGQEVPAGVTEVAEQTLNRIFDFFGVRKTPTIMVRPVPEK